MREQEPGDEAIAVLVDVVRSAGRDLNAGQRLQLDRLISQGYVVIADQGDGVAYKVTAEGQRLLDSRGVGANEA